MAAPPWLHEVMRLGHGAVKNRKRSAAFGRNQKGRCHTWRNWCATGFASVLLSRGKALAKPVAHSPVAAVRRRSWQRVAPRLGGSAGSFSPRVERLAFDQVADDERAIRFAQQFVNTHDVRMLQPRGGSYFSLQKRALFQTVRSWDLDRNDLAGRFIRRLKDVGEFATAKVLTDLVARQPLQTVATVREAFEFDQGIAGLTVRTGDELGLGIQAGFNRLDTTRTRPPHTAATHQAVTWRKGTCFSVIRLRADCLWFRNRAQGKGRGEEGTTDGTDAADRHGSVVLSRRGKERDAAAERARKGCGVMRRRGWRTCTALGPPCEVTE